MPALSGGESSREYVFKELQRRGISSEVAEYMIENLEMAGILEALGLLLLMTAKGDGILQRLEDLGSLQVEELKPRLASVVEKVDELVREMASDPDVASKPGPLSRALGKAFGKGGVARRYSPRIESLMDSLEAVLWAIEEEARKVLLRKLETLEADARELLGAAERGEFSEIASKLRGHLAKVEELLSSPLKSTSDLEAALIETQRIDSEIREIREVLARSKEARAALAAELSRIRGQIESIRLKASRIKETGIDPMYIEDSVRWIEARIARIENRCPPEDLECMETALADLRSLEQRALKPLLDELEKLERLSSEFENTFALIPEAEKAAEMLDGEFNTNAFTALIGSLAVRLSSIRAGTVVRDYEDIEKIAQEVKSIRETLELLIFIRRAEQRSGPISQQLKLVSDGDAVLATIRAALQVPTMSPEEKARQALAPLKEVQRKLSEYLEAAADAERFYPYWREYVLTSLARTGTLRMADLVKIPERWRSWVIGRLRDEGLVELEGDLVKPSGVEVPRPKPAPLMEERRLEAVKPAVRPQEPRPLGPAAAEAPEPKLEEAPTQTPTAPATEEAALRPAIPPQAPPSAPEAPPPTPAVDTIAELLDLLEEKLGAPVSSGSVAELRRVLSAGGTGRAASDLPDLLSRLARRIP
ncbi:MAG: hypothetical protein QI223_08280 [Candidatus Korarchaeota archaeon]|nr:hypothetical protein [Candidatus Korarchaeota archaeon]